MAECEGSDVPRWERACKVFDDELREAGGAIRAVACSDSFVITSSSRPVVKVWQVADAGLSHTQTLSIVDSHGAVGSSCVEISHDGQQAAVCYDDGGIGLWDLRSGKRTTELEADIPAAWKAKFLPGGRRLVSGGPSGALFFWELRAGGRLEREVGARSTLAQVKATEDKVKRRRTEAKPTPEDEDGAHELAKPASPVYSLAVSPDGSLLSCGRGSGSVSVMRLDTLAWASDIHAHSSGVGRSSVAVRAVAFDPESRLLASGGDDHHICLFDAASWSRGRSREVSLERFSAHRKWVTSLSMCPDPTRHIVLTTSWDGTVKIWDYSTHALLQTDREHVGSVFCSTFAPSDGRFFVSAGVDAQIVLYSAKHTPVRCGTPAKDVVGMATKDDKGAVKTKDGNTT